MKKQITLWIRRGLLAFALICGLVTMYRTIESIGGTESYDLAEEIAFQQEENPVRETTAKEQPVAETQPQQVQAQKWVPEPLPEDDEYFEKMQSVDLAALREVNPEVIGWIYVPGTHINYPIMQGEDNEFYLKHTWQNVKNTVGAIFMECRNYPDFADFNTILYGHNMRNNSMFGDLDQFKGAWFASRTPYVYVANDEGTFRYEVFSYHSAPVDSFVYGVSFNQRDTRENFIAAAIEACEDDLGIVPAYTDRILTLSTCTGSTHENRWVVHARLKMVRVE